MAWEPGAKERSCGAIDLGGVSKEILAQPWRGGKHVDGKKTGAKDGIPGIQHTQGVDKGRRTCGNTQETEGGREPPYHPEQVWALSNRMGRWIISLGRGKDGG